MKTPAARLKITSDEIPIWLTSMGLSIGLVMIVFLLGLVVVNGSQVFWPRRIAQAELRAAGSAPAAVIAGEITKKQIKAAPLARQRGESERQFYVGNKETYGYSFKYVDEKDIAGVSYPPDLASIERMEYGDAIGFPVSLERKGREPLASGGAAFEAELGRLVQEAGRRRREIGRLEKSEIGAINARMQALRWQEKSAAEADGPKRESIRRKIALLQGQYEELAARAKSLRLQQQDDALVYRLASGEEKRLAVGQIVGIEYRNRMAVWERLAAALGHFWGFLADEPREANTEGGIFPAIFGTFVMTLLMSLAVTPFGVLAAIYLREYAKQGVLVRAVRIAVNNLAGVPSIVFGVFGLGFFVYFVGGTLDSVFFRERLPTPTFGTGGIFWASLTLALMTVPVVIVATEEALAAVARGVREGSLACGASKWQTIQHVVLPASAPGIMTGLILAMARGAGEVAPLMLVGVVKLAPSLPIDATFPFAHLERKFMHLGFHIYDLGFQSPDSEAAKPMVFATTFLLIGLVVVLNLGAILIRERLRRKYAVGAF